MNSATSTKSRAVRRGPSPPTLISLWLAWAGLALLGFGLVAPAVCGAEAAPASIAVQVDKPGAPIASTMFGVFFEDINFGADGGLYAELVKNRSFEFPEPLLGWRAIDSPGPKGTRAVLDQDPLNPRNPHYLRLERNEAGEGFGVANEGFRGIGVREGATYHFSVSARAPRGGPLTLRIQLAAPDGQTLGQAQLTGFSPQWKRFTLSLRPSATTAKAQLVLLLEGRGALDLDMVSLFPKDTWKGRANGLRADLVQMLKDLRPGFVRFPGGCIVEGRHLETRYQWKNTIGNPAERRLLINRWNNEFAHRPAPDYYQSFGLGFFEYFLLCEDLGAEPLPILNCGMACQFNSSELAPLDQLDPYVQDALDLIEFANGPVSSPWGGRRAQLGHPAPFHLKLLGVGNEQWGQQYLERFDRFAQALKARHPEVALISSAGPSPNDDRFHFLWAGLRQRRADIIDEHCYDAPAWFFANAGRYDAYPRTGPKVFMGEYAAQSVAVAKPDNRNTWECALAEAAFMTGLERNADVVVMSSYAPLFGHTEAWQWTPNLIWCDNLRVFGTANYYVQKLFSVNRGSALLPVRVQGSTPTAQTGLYASATLDTPKGQVILKLVNHSPADRDVRVRLDGAGKVNQAGTAVVLASRDLQAENSLTEPTRIAPVEAKLSVPSTEFSYRLLPNSLTVLRVGCAAR